MARARASDFEEKQHGLLRSAAAIFAEQGMEKASMAQIANRAGVSKALLYHYYPSKDVLIFEIIHGHLVDLEVSIALALDDALSPEEQLRALVRVVLEKYRGADDAHKVQLIGGATLSESRREEIRATERRVVRHFSQVLKRIRPELDRPERPLLMPVTMSLFGILNWVYMWFHDDRAITREEFADIASTLILEGLRGVR